MQTSLRLALVLGTTVITAGGDLGAQIRTPRATEPLTTTVPGPAPTNARVTVTALNAATVAWDAMPGLKFVEIQRTRIDNASCCVRQSGMLTTTYWNDTGLEAGREYVYMINAQYTDGRTGRTQVIAVIAQPQLPVVNVRRNATMAATDGVLRLTPCGARGGAAPAPTNLRVTGQNPAGARIQWDLVPGMNYVVERTPVGSETWTLVGSTCGGVSPVVPRSDLPSAMNVQDVVGGVQGEVTYRVTAVSSSGQVGWNTLRWTPMCKGSIVANTVVTGSSVQVDWTFNSNCPGGGVSPPSPQILRVTSSFGFTGDYVGGPNGSFSVHGVPRGSHTFTLTTVWNPDARASTPVPATVQY